MKHRPSLTLLVLLMILPVRFTLQAATPPSNEEQPLRRYALIVGANDGGPERTRLRYALRDAEALRDVLSDLGGVEDKGIVYLSEPDGDAFFSALNQLRQTVESEKNSHSRTEFIFYYSGHSDERHILFSQERIPYSAVRSSIESIATDVRIVILDSCASGAFTRAKGGKKRPPFMIDKAYDMKGFAFMSSSSSDEASQESERLKGSFFTHNLVAGLRGAADMNQDGRITLTEAYQYTFDHTLSQTANTISGPQHPHKTIQMEGTGDVVITDLRRSPHHLVFAADVFGTLLLRTPEGRLVVELHKVPGRKLEMGLEAGSYQIINIRSNQYYDTSVTLAEARSQHLTLAHFTRGKALPTRSRGSSPDPAASDLLPIHVTTPFKPLRLTLLDLPDDRTHNDQFLLHLFLAYSNHLRGLSFGSGLHAVYGQVQGAQISGIASTVAGDMRYLQLSGLFNTVNRHSQGVQIGGTMNYTRLSMSGLQLAGILNISGSFQGLQLSGAVNFAEQKMSGLQIAPINIAKEVRGLQIGLVNIARKRSDYFLGLFNYSPDNEISLSYSSDDVRFSTLGIKTGNHRCYNLFMTGVDFSFAQNTVGLGWGIHLVPGRWLSLDMDLSSKLVFERNSFYGSKTGVHSALRSSLLIHLGRRFRLTGGISLNHYTATEDLFWTEDGQSTPSGTYPVLRDSIFGYDFDMTKSRHTWVGLHIGVEYVLKQGR